jgi:exodeoxyribonuclease VII large subunit
MLPILTPSQFVALFNATLEMAYPVVEIEGEVLNYKVSKNRWVYFDIADENARLRCFGTVYMLPAPIEDGMRVKILASPRLHPQFNFSLNLQSLQFSGEGTIKKAAAMLMEKLTTEGLFAEERKRPVPYPPERIALVTSGESAAYKDFNKVLSERYGGIIIEHADVTVQGDSAAGQIVRAIEWFNRAAVVADVIVIIRGGGSADDLQAFSSEQVTRAVAASRIPTVVAIGHEVDVSLAELAADLRASTPSNAAELLVPDRRDLLERLSKSNNTLHKTALNCLDRQLVNVIDSLSRLNDSADRSLNDKDKVYKHMIRTLEALSPQTILKRGYAVVRKSGVVVRNSKSLTRQNLVDIQFADGSIKAEVQ